MYSKAALVSFLGLAAAQLHAPVGDPKGNPISRPLNEIVPKCEPFTITWQPTTSNTVSVLLLKGPSTNVVKFGPALAQGIANSGSLPWTPAPDLPVTDGNTGYGLQIIDDVTGEYQYSTQFGISAGKCGDQSNPAPSGAPGGGYPTNPPPAKETYPTNPPPAKETYPANPPPAKETYPANPPPAENTPVSPANPYPTAPYPTAPVAVPPPVGTGGVYPNTTVPKPGHGNNTTTPPPEVSHSGASALEAVISLSGAAAAIAALML